MTRSRRIGARLAALLLLVLGTHADAMVLCATRRGDVVADGRCRKREVQLDARDLGVVGAVGLPGPDGPAGPAGADVARPFAIVDANGKRACTPLGGDGRLIQCLLEPDAESAPVQLVLLRDGTDPERPYVYYGVPGCQGPPFMSEPAGLIARAVLLNSRLFVPSGPRVPLGALSSAQVHDTCSNGSRTPDGTCCVDHASAVEVMAAPARQIELSTLGLTAPLRGENR